MGNARLGGFQADRRHGVLELLAILGLFDGLGVRADQLDVVFREHAMLFEIKRAIERGLPAHRGKHGVRALFFNDALDHLPGDGLDVGDVGSGRIRHDGRRVAVDEDRAEALVLQGLAGLCA